MWVNAPLYRKTRKYNTERENRMTIKSTLKIIFFTCLGILSTVTMADEWDSPINSKIGVVQSDGKILEVESAIVKPTSAVKWWTSMTYNFVMQGATSDVSTVAPTAIRLIGINPKKIRNINLVKFQLKDGKREWTMKATTSDFTPSPENEAYPVSSRPTPVKGEDGVYVFTFPKPLESGEYGLQISAEVWDFTVK
jgi:hypothetical protein